MNTFKKILMLALAMMLLVCATLSFVSCDEEEENNSGNNGTTNIPEDYHCPDDCDCRLDDIPQDTTPSATTYVVVVRDDQGQIVSGVKVMVSNGEKNVTKTTDENGFLTFPLTQDTWVARVVDIPTGYDLDKTQAFHFNAEGLCVVELVKPDTQGTSATNPIYAEDNAIVSDIDNGSVVWYSVKTAADRSIVVNDPDAYVVYNGNDYYPEEGVIEVALVEDNSFNICFGIGYKSEADDAAETKTIEANLVSPLGYFENPIVLDSIAELDIVTVNADADGNEVWYKWTASFSGKLILSSANENAAIQIFDGVTLTELADDTQYELIKDKDIYICVSATAETAAEVEVNIDQIVYVRYIAEVYDIEQNPIAGNTVIFTDADDNVVATLVTNDLGMVEVLLPAGEYNVTTTAPEGFVMDDLTVTANWTNAFFYARNYVLADFANEEGDGYTFTVPAAGSCSITDRGIVGLYTFTFNGADGVKVVLNGEEYTATEGKIEFVFAGTMRNPTSLEIINTTDAEVTVTATLERVLGYSFETPLTVTDGTHTASFNSAYGDAVYYNYTATAAGTVKFTAANTEASMVVNNATQWTWGDTHDTAPISFEVEVAEGDVLEVIVGVNNWDTTEAEIEFTIEFIPASAAE